MGGLHRIEELSQGLEAAQVAAAQQRRQMEELHRVSQLCAPTNYTRPCSQAITDAWVCCEQGVSEKDELLRVRNSTPLPCLTWNAQPHVADGALPGGARDAEQDDAEAGGDEQGARAGSLGLTGPPSFPLPFRAASISPSMHVRSNQ